MRYVALCRRSLTAACSARLIVAPTAIETSSTIRSPSHVHRSDVGRALVRLTSVIALVCLAFRSDISSAQSVWFQTSPSSSEININSQASTNFHTALPTVMLQTINPTAPYYILMSPGSDLVIPSAEVSVSGSNYNGSSPQTGQSGVVYGVAVQGAGLWASQKNPTPLKTGQYSFSNGPSITLNSSANIFSNWQASSDSWPLPTNVPDVWEQWYLSNPPEPERHYSQTNRSYFWTIPTPLPNIYRL